MRAVGLILAPVLVLGALPLVILLGADIQPIQSFSSSVGATSLLATVATAPGTARAYPTALLGRLVSRHRASQDLVRITGSLSLLIDQIQVKSPDKVTAARVKTLAKLIQGNGANKAILHSSGGMKQVVKLVQRGSEAAPAAGAAHAIAAFTTGRNASIYRATVQAANGVPALLMCLDGGANSKATQYATWALANMLADNPAAQAQVLKHDAVDGLTRLVWEGPDHPITPAALHAIANLATDNKQAQDALREAGAIEPVVKLVEAGGEGGKGQDSDVFKAEVVQHLLTLQVSHPALREAIQEVGGVDQLLELVETGVGITEHKTRSYPLAIYYGEDDHPEVDEDVAHGLAGIRRLVQTLQDQVDSSSTAPAADDSTLPSSARKVSSNAQAFVLDSIHRVSREIVAAKAAWALANLAANSKENQDAIRQAGGIEPLVSLLQGGQEKRAIKNASWALANLAKSNSDNKAAIREAKGIQGMVKLLAANPDDKEVVKEVARALKFMAAEKSLPEKAKRHGMALLSRWSRHVSYALHDKFEWRVDDSAVWKATVGCMVAGAFTVLGVLRCFLA